MYKPEDIEKINQELQEAARKAVTNPPALERVVEAMRVFENWRIAPTDELPLAVAQLLGINRADSAEAPTAPDLSPEKPTQQRAPAKVTDVTDEEAVSASLDDIRELMGKEKFVEAAARLPVHDSDQPKRCPAASPSAVQTGVRSAPASTTRPR